MTSAPNDDGPAHAGRRAFRVARVVLVALLLYAALVGTAALSYRAVVFPAPRRGVAPVAPGAERIERDVAGQPLVALFAPSRISTATARSSATSRRSPRG